MKGLKLQLSRISGFSQMAANVEALAMLGLRITNFQKQIKYEQRTKQRKRKQGTTHS